MNELVKTAAASSDSQEHWTVGGIRMPRPFRIRRLGHFGINVDDVPPTLDFYVRLLGFRVSDPIDFGGRLPEAQRNAHGHTCGYFLRHGTDHHSFAVFPKRVISAIPNRPQLPAGITTNQITWQVGSLREVVEADRWFRARNLGIYRAGRDLPGSNWHVYTYDLDRHINELYYGIEQIGWNGHSKPADMHRFRFHDTATLPQKSEFAEVAEAMAHGADPVSGLCQTEAANETYDVGGVLLGRPFKITKIGPVRLFVSDVDAQTRFYCEVFGFEISEEVTWRGHRCVFLRANTEHHSLALYPLALRKELGLAEHTSVMSFGLQLGEYSQLRDAIPFLKGNGVTIKYLPPELSPGIDYSAFAIDPSGHAVQLYYYMEQIGWDGRPCPPEKRRKIDNNNWPAELDARSDTYLGEAYFGPWG